MVSIYRQLAQTATEALEAPMAECRAMIAAQDMSSASKTRTKPPAQDATSISSEEEEEDDDASYESDTEPVPIAPSNGRRPFIASKAPAYTKVSDIPASGSGRRTSEAQKLMDSLSLLQKPTGMRRTIPRVAQYVDTPTTAPKRSTAKSTTNATPSKKDDSSDEDDSDVEAPPKPVAKKTRAPRIKKAGTPVPSSLDLTNLKEVETQDEVDTQAPAPKRRAPRTKKVAATKEVVEQQDEPAHDPTMACDPVVPLTEQEVPSTKKRGRPKSTEPEKDIPVDMEGPLAKRFKLAEESSEQERISTMKRVVLGALKMAKNACLISDVSCLHDPVLASQLQRMALDFAQRFTASAVHIPQ